MNQETQNSMSEKSLLFMYAIGYFLSLAITLGVFGLAYIHLQSGHILMTHERLHFWITFFALTQAVLQSIFFLHLSRDPKARYSLLAFLFTVYSVVFIVIGSLWIMDNLKYNMTPDATNAYLHKEN